MTHALLFYDVSVAQQSLWLCFEERMGDKQAAGIWHTGINRYEKLGDGLEKEGKSRHAQPRSRKEQANQRAYNALCRIIMEQLITEKSDSVPSACCL
jgi:hypothetical protein